LLDRSSDDDEKEVDNDDDDDDDYVRGMIQQYSYCHSVLHHIIKHAFCFNLARSRVIYESLDIGSS